MTPDKANNTRRQQELAKIPRHERWRQVQKETDALPPSLMHSGRRKAQHAIWKRWGV